MVARTKRSGFQFALTAGAQVPSIRLQCRAILNLPILI